ncbi:MAG: diaminopimelate epimerase [Proteobacteria bacterium]|nr:diaminopimelate epimerase [Pseudomonadota bacterium]
MDISFMKMEGIGNDFIVIDDRNMAIEQTYSYHTLAVKLCDRRFGIGADGLLIVRDSKTCDLCLKIFNSDGSEAQMCGNGVRCLARYAYESGITDKPKIRIETQAGVIIPRLNRDDKGVIRTVTVDMGEPILDPVKIPFYAPHPGTLTEAIETPLGIVTITAVSMGNPHAVIFTDHVSQSPISELGPFLETHPLFPEKTNVEFIQVLSDRELRMKVWERGAGITLACGTGACAAVVAAILNGKTIDKVLVHLDGGDLHIEWDRKTNHIFKTGPAHVVFQGRITL